MNFKFSFIRHKTCWEKIPRRWPNKNLNRFLKTAPLKNREKKGRRLKKEVDTFSALAACSCPWRPYWVGRRSFSHCCCCCCCLGGWCSWSCPRFGSCRLRLLRPAQRATWQSGLTAGSFGWRVGVEGPHSWWRPAGLPFDSSSSSCCCCCCCALPRFAH